MICKKIHLSIFSSPFAHTHKGWSHLADLNISLVSKLSVYREKEKPLPGNGIPPTRRDHYSQHTSGQHCLLWSRGVATTTTPCDQAPWYQQCSKAWLITWKKSKKIRYEPWCSYEYVQESSYSSSLKVWAFYAHHQGISLSEHWVTWAKQWSMWGMTHFHVTPERTGSNGHNVVSKKWLDCWPEVSKAVAETQTEPCSHHARLS